MCVVLERSGPAGRRNCTKEGRTLVGMTSQTNWTTAVFANGVKSLQCVDCFLPDRGSCAEIGVSSNRFAFASDQKLLFLTIIFINYIIIRRHFHSTLMSMHANVAD